MDIWDVSSYFIFLLYCKWYFFRLLIPIFHCLYQKWTPGLLSQICPTPHLPHFTRWQRHPPSPYSKASETSMTLHSHGMSNQWANLVSSTFKTYPKCNHLLLPPLQPSWPQTQIPLIWTIILTGLSAPASAPYGLFYRVSRVAILKHKSNNFTVLTQSIQLLTISPNLNQKLPQLPIRPYTIQPCSLTGPISCLPSPHALHSPCYFSNATTMPPPGIYLSLLPGSFTCI